MTGFETYRRSWSTGEGCSIIFTPKTLALLAMLARVAYPDTAWWNILSQTRGEEGEAQEGYGQVYS